MASSIDNPRVATSAAEHFDGSSGSKTVSYANSPLVSAISSVTGVFVDLSAAAVDSGYRGKRGHAEGDRYINIENLIGSDHVDRLYGDDNANTLIGGGSRDLLRGNGGNDILIGGAGQDQLDGHAGNDMLDGGAGADTFFGGSGTDTVTYADSPDENNDGEGVTLNLGDTYLDDRSGHTFSRATGDHAGRTRSEDRFNSIENLIGSAFADTFTGDANNNKFEGGGGDDTLAGGAGTNELYGGAGDDTFLGGAGADKFDGGSGSDTISYASSTDGVTVNLRSLSVFSGGDAAGDRLLVLDTIENLIGSDRVDTFTGDEHNNEFKGNGGDDIFYGNAGDDTLIGNAGHDQMFGGNGDDMLIGGEHGDALFGGYAVVGESTGEGTDTVSYEFSPDSNNDGLGVTLDLSVLKKSGDYMISLGRGDDAEQDRVKDVENIIGSAFDDTLTGHDVLRYEDNEKNRDEDRVGDIRDVGANDLKGLAGDDILSGKGGNDTLVGGEGNDTLDGGTGNDTYVFAGSYGADTIKGNSGAAILSFVDAGGLGDFRFSRADNNDVVITTVSNSVTGSVTILAVVYGDGRYTIQHGTGSELKILGKLYLGTDEVDDDFTGTAGADLMLGLGGNDELQGGAGADTLFGGAQHDILKGGAGMDRLYGGVGNDILEGGDNGDKFFGGEDYDTISYASSDDFVDVNLRDRTFDGGHAEGDSMSTSASIEGIIGSGHDDTLTGDEGVNTLTGGLGNDTLEGGEGDDFLEGGGGTDTYVFDGEWGADTIQKDTDGGLLRFVDAAGIGDFRFSRADANSDAVITTGSNSVTIVANAYGHGRYTLQHDSGSAIKTLGKLYLGTTGNDKDDDKLVGSGDADLIFGFAGDDRLEGGADDDTLFGGAQHDILKGGADNDRLYGERGDDTLRGGAGDDTLDGGLHDDDLYGGLGYDTYVFAGSYGADTIKGDTDGGILSFVDAEGLGDFRFSRADNNDVVITTVSNSVTGSVTILAVAYGDGRYTIQHGTGSELKILGKLTLGTNGNDNGDDKLVGTDGADVLVGLRGNDELQGGGGADILYGGAQHDTLKGGAGADTLYGGRGDDTLDGGADGDTFDGGDGSDTISYASYEDNDDPTAGIDANLKANTFLKGDAAGDSIAAGALRSIENLIGSAGDDVLTGDGFANKLSGGLGNDKLYGNAGDDILEGGGGTDRYTFEGSYGADTIQEDPDGGFLQFFNAAGIGDFRFSRADANSDAVITTGSNSVTIVAASYEDGRYTLQIGSGSAITTLGKLYIGTTGNDKDDDKLVGSGDADLLLGLHGEDTLDGGLGDDTLFGGRHQDILKGGADDDRLYGEGGDDTLRGGAGDDTLYGGLHDDDLYGGLGDDTYVFAGSYGADTIKGDTDGGILSFVDAEGLGDFRFSRADNNDVVITTVSNSVTGSVTILAVAYGDGRYTIQHGTGSELKILGKLTLGTNGNDNGDDKLVGTDGADVLLGLRGNDELQGGGGADILYGGAQHDTLKGGAGADTLYGGRGDDTLDGGADGDTFDGGDGSDTISYASYEDNDDPTAGIDANLKANTFLKGDAAGDSIAAGALRSIENLIGSAGDDVLTGDGFANKLSGGLGNDKLYGGGGVDTLFGGAGDDTLDGGADDDTLAGGTGVDTYVFGGNWGADTIKGDTDGGILSFVDVDAAGLGGFRFSRADANSDAVITIGSNSVTIVAAFYADGRYTLQVGLGDDLKTLGKLKIGTNGNDNGDDKLGGTDGADLLLGLHGEDTLDGGLGDDTLFGGRHQDILKGGADNDRLYGEGGDDTLRGGAGDDTLYGGLHDDDLYGGVGDDTYVFAGSYGADTIKGDTDGGTLYFQDATSLTDLTFSLDTTTNTLVISVGDNSVTIEGYADGRYTIQHGTGSELKILGKLTFGTDEVDDLVGTDGGDLLLGLRGNDELQGGLDDDTLFGGAQHDILKGGAGEDTLYGGRGDDTLDGGADGDTFDGGIGIDTLTYASYVGSTPADGVTVNLGTNSFSRGDAQGDSLLVPGNIENLIGSAGDDELTGDAGENTLTGGAGADTLQGGAGDDILVGGAGADTYVIGAGAKRNHAIIRGDENDPVGVVGTDDVVNRLIFQTSGTEYKGFGESAHGSGKNVANPFFTVSHDGNSVTISLNSLLLDQGTYIDGVRQVIYVEILDIASLTIENFVSGRYEVFTRESATTGTEVSRGIFSAVKETAEGVEAVAFNGGAGRDYIIGSVGADIINGLGEDDFIEGGRGDDVIDGGEGADEIRGERGNDIIHGGSGYNTLRGGGGADRIYGGDDDTNFIYGGLGNDILFGGARYDRFDGGAGDDFFYGGAGDDAIYDDDVRGNNFAEGGAGGDVMSLGMGIDTVSYEHSEDTDGNGRGVTVDLSDTDLVFGISRPTGDDAAGDRLAGIENLIGSALGDTLTGHSVLLYEDNEENRALGRVGEVVLYENNEANRALGIVGEIKDDGVNVLRGLAGDDTLEGGGSNDILEGGAGTDTYVFGGKWGADTIRGDTYKGWDLDQAWDSDSYTGPAFQFRNGQNGDTDGGTLLFQDATSLTDLTFAKLTNGDLLITHDSDTYGSNSVRIKNYADGLYGISYGTGSELTVFGKLALGTDGNDKGDDKLVGTDVVDLLFGFSGDDTLEGLAGADRLDGGADEDTVLYSRAQASSGILGVTVDLSANTGAGSDAQGDTFFNVENVIGSNFADTLTGDEFANKLSGGLGNDKLYGGGGDDTLFGGDGDDTLDGGGGDDTLRGGVGAADTYVFGGNWGADTIKGDTDGGILSFVDVDAAGLGGFRFSRADNNDVLITHGSNSVTIVAAFYADGRYTLQVGLGDDLKTLGKLKIGTNGNDNGDDKLVGTDGADLLLGLHGEDTLDGGLGDDTLFGGRHQDILKGGADDDRLYGEGGDDTLRGGAGDDTLYGGLHDDDLYGGVGNDTYVFAGSYGADTIKGNMEGAILSFVDAEGLGDFRFSRADNNDVTITTVSNSVTGSVTILAVAYGDGRYTLQHGTGSATTTLGKLTLGTNGNDNGDDELVGTDGADVLVGLRGNDELQGGGGADTLFGGAQHDTLKGGAGADTLYGGRGDDILEGGADGDTFDGGAGIDTISYASYEDNDDPTAGIDANLAKNSFSRGDAKGDSIAAGALGSVENLIGSRGNDRLSGDAGVNTLTGGLGDDYFYGNAGDDILEGGGGTDRYTFEGSYGADTIQEDPDGGVLHFLNAEGLGDFRFLRADNNDVTITTVSNSVTGSVTILAVAYGDGRYTLQHGTGSATTTLGKLTLGTNGNDNGDDKLVGTDGADVLVGLRGNDELQGGGGADTLFGGAQHDILKGGAGADTLYGGRGDDTLEGGAGADTFDGGDGSDTISYASYEDNDDPTAGIDANLKANTFSKGDAQGDSIAAGALRSIENLIGSRGNDELSGDEFANKLSGGLGNDKLYGGGGDDTLFGGDGDDTLDGGGGDDTLRGGVGAADTYVFGGNWGADTIKGDTDGGILSFVDVDAAGLGGFRFSRADNNDVLITHGSNSVTIVAAFYADGRYTLQVGLGDDLKTLGKLKIGTNGNDNGDDKLVGTDGADLLLGLHGEDTLDGGLGDDTLFGGRHQDILKGGADDDRLYGEGGDDTLRGGAGDDTLYGGLHDDDLYGGVGNDTYVFAGSYGADTIKGNMEGAILSFVDAEGLGDFRFSRADNNDVTITTVSNSVTGSVTILAVAYGDGRYTLQHGTGSATTTLGKLTLGTNGNDNGDDELVGTDGADVLVGLRGNDELQGGGGADTLFGGAQHDTLKGGAGADTLYGGRGDDTYVFEGSYGADTIKGDTDGGTLYFQDATSLTDLTFSLDTTTNTLVISVGDNSVTIEGYADRLFGISYGTGTELKILGKLYLGTDEVDDLTGTDGGDLLLGLRGNDELQGGGGADTLYGGAQHDILKGGGGADTLYGGRGNDILEGGAGNDYLYGGGGVDKLYGGAEQDVLYGGEGNDILEGGAGVDYLYGGGGVDKLYGGAEQDVLDGGEGDDILEGGAGNDQFYAGNGDDTLYGGLGNDRLFGDADNDTIYGGDNADTLYGGMGDDILEGGKGADIFDGGEGSDTISYENSLAGVIVNLSNNSFGNKNPTNSIDSDAIGDSIAQSAIGSIENIRGSDHIDELVGDDQDNILSGGKGNDELSGGAGEDTYVFEVGGGADSVSDVSNDELTLFFQGADYEAADFREASNNFNRVGNNLEITLDKDSDDDVVDKVTILNAFDTDTDTGTGNSAFTIHVAYGSEGTFTEVSNDFWHALLS